ncbi:MAG: hypothetical protein QOC55_398 [Thermoleophilaceae bacterium]|nr:hypothetical protein [Thermoleophilaceae bacterium]
MAEEKKARKAAPGKKASSAKKAAPAKKAGETKKASTSAKRAPAKKAAKSTAKKAAGTTAVAHEDIAAHAYYIHEREGGDATENWLRAERELSEG